MPFEPLSLDVIMECLGRSGYLLESSLVRALEERGFFIEPNQVVRDHRTGKSREIDLVAEYYDRNLNHPRTVVKTYFVAEIINNKYPFVLLTQRPYSPNEDIESHVKFICTPESNSFTDQVDIYEERSPERETLFSQYCVLSIKGSGKSELMASHSDDVYGSLQKLSEYIEGEIRSWDSMELVNIGGIWRIFFWHPMLVLGGQLIAAYTLDDGSTELRNITSAHLEFNWHEVDDRRTTVVEVLTVDAFLPRVEAIVKGDSLLEARLLEIRASIQGERG